MAIEIVDFPIKNGESFHSYVKLPEGNKNNSARFELFSFNSSARTRGIHHAFW